MRLLFFLVLTMSWAGIASANGAGLSLDERAKLIERGLTAFDRGANLASESPAESEASYVEAAHAFQRVVDSGTQNGLLYYNLGNARLRCGQLGQAIANYRRAEKFIPNDARLQENLQYARSLCGYDILETTERAVARTLFFWHFSIPLKTRLAVGLAAYLFFWVLLLARLAAPRFSIRYALIASSAIWMTLAASVAVDLKNASSPKAGVIAGGEVVVRKGNGFGYDPQLEEPLVGGVEFEVLEQREAWLHISLPDGKDGWVPKSRAEVF